MSQPGPSLKVSEAIRPWRFGPPEKGTLVDSCVLIDVFANDAIWADWSLGQLDAQSREGPLIINPIILAEVSPRFEPASDLEAALSGLPLVRQALPRDAAFLAGQAFKLYRKSLGQKTSQMPDFYIGAHAIVGNPRLLTRGVTRHSTSFPRLAIVGP